MKKKKEMKAVVDKAYMLVLPTVLTRIHRLDNSSPHLTPFFFKHRKDPPNFL